MKITRTQLAWLLSDLLIEAIEGSSKDNTAGCRSGGKASNPEYSDGIMGYSTECPPEQSFYTCDHMSVQKCGVDVNGTSGPFSCKQEAEAFGCESTVEINDRPPFECGSEKFECGDVGFRCLGRFQCPEGGSYQCDANAFECLNHQLEYVFECKDAETEFDCTGAELYDFNCNRGAPPPPALPPQSFDCPSSSEHPEFQCTVQHIFGCFEGFNCPSSHTCSSPENGDLTCDSEHPWQPGSDGRDDGSPGDFDCCVFTCGASQPNGEEKFDCTTESDFKCLDGTEVSEGRFQCGLGSEFECGEEEERFVCMNYRCEDNFRCESAFHCGNKEKGREYECSILNFQCRQVTPNPAEDGYACDEEAGGYICEVFNCDQEGYECNPPNEFAGCSEGYKVPEPWP